MNHEVITHVPITKEVNDFDGSVKVHRQLGAAAISEVPDFSGSGAVTPGEVVVEASADSIVPIDSHDRIVAIGEQSAVTVNPRKVPGTDAYAAEQGRIADEARSNLF